MILHAVPLDTNEPVSGKQSNDSIVVRVGSWMWFTSHGFGSSANNTATPKFDGASFANITWQVGSKRDHSRGHAILRPDYSRLFVAVSAGDLICVKLTTSLSRA